jgi:hypothetical protein
VARGFLDGSRVEVGHEHLAAGRIDAEVSWKHAGRDDAEQSGPARQGSGRVDDRDGLRRFTAGARYQAAVGVADQRDAPVIGENQADRLGAGPVP